MDTWRGVCRTVSNNVITGIDSKGLKKPGGLTSGQSFPAHEVSKFINTPQGKLTSIQCMLFAGK